MLILFTAMILALIACQPAIVPQQDTTPTQTECNPPYYEYSAGDCCLDDDANQICDRYENKTTIQINKTYGPQEPPKSPVSDAIAKFKSTVTGYSYQINKDEYYVRGEQIRIKYPLFKRLNQKINNTIPVAITDVYIDRSVPEAIGYCDPRRDISMMGGDFDPDRNVCAEIMDIPITLSYQEYNPTLPEDWLVRFSYAAPTLVEESNQYVKDFSGWKAVNPVLHFIENGDEYVLRLDTKTGLPLKVEIAEAVPKTISFSGFVHNSVKPDEVVYKKFNK